MIKLFSTLLMLIIFAPAGLLWWLAETLYVIIFFIKMLCSVLATLALAVGANFDDYTRTYTFHDDIIGTTKRLIRTEIAVQMEALHLSSVFFERK